MSANAENLPILWVDIVQYPQAKTFVAECQQVPIIVEGETFEKVEEKMHLAMTGYFEIFPDERLTVITRSTISRTYLRKDSREDASSNKLSGHNWHQIKAVLEELEYRQVEDYSNEILYLRNQRTDKIFGFLKSKNMSMRYLLTILRRIDLSYDEFVRNYRETTSNESKGDVQAP